MITLDKLTYFYRNTVNAAVSDATAQIGPGFHLLLGENGAGKTTLLHLIAGLLSPSSGTVAIDGETPSKREPQTLQRVFFVTDNMEIPADTINDFARHHSPFYPSFDATIFADALRELGLTGDETISDLSLGNRKKAILAYALGLKTEILLLDEPANGLDITAKQTLQQLFARYIDETQTVILSTHTPAEFAYLYDGLILLNRSNLILSMPTWQITERISFGAAMLPPAEPLYMEQRMGLFRFVTTADPEQPTDMDYLLLYNALLSPVAGNIIAHLKTTADNE